MQVAKRPSGFRLSDPTVDRTKPSNLEQALIVGVFLYAE